MIGCLLTMLLGLIISVIINTVQRRRVFKINSVQKANNIHLNTEPTLRTTDKNNANAAPSITVDPKTTEEGGHVNHAIRLDDE